MTVSIGLANGIEIVMENVEHYEVDYTRARVAIDRGGCYSYLNWSHVAYIIAEEDSDENKSN